MALKNPSLILYGFTVDVSNQYIDFQASGGGGVLTATIPMGAYCLGDLLTAISAAMAAADPSHTYTVTADRTIAGGTQNRVTIKTSGTFLSLLFATGGHAAASAAVLLGYGPTDLTGATQYSGIQSAGTSIIPVMQGYNWVSPNRLHRAFGNVNVSANGTKEATVFQIQKFFEVEFRYEPESIIDTVWQPFFDWAIQQQDFEFTPDITQPTTFYPCTLESTDEDGQGLGFRMSEMLPEFPGLYQTGKLAMRQNLTASTFI